MPFNTSKGLMFDIFVITYFGRAIIKRDIILGLERPL
jgi:hypothetical protein